MNVSPTLIVVVILVDLILATTLGFDARRKRIPTYGRKYTLNTGGLAWAFAFLLLPIVVGPAYLFKRIRFQEPTDSEFTDDTVEFDHAPVTCRYIWDRSEACHAARSEWNNIAGGAAKRLLATLSWMFIAVLVLTYGITLGFHWLQFVVVSIAVIGLVVLVVLPKLQIWIAFKGQNFESIRIEWEISEHGLSCRAGELASSILSWDIHTLARVDAAGVTLMRGKTGQSWFPRSGFQNHLAYRKFLHFLDVRGIKIKPTEDGTLEEIRRGD